MPYTTSLNPEEMKGLGAHLEDLSVQLVKLEGPIPGSSMSLGALDLLYAAVQVRDDAKKRAREVADWIGRASEAVHETTAGFEAADDASRQAFERNAADVYGSADRED
jgi:glycosyl transferase, family 3